jgi:N-ethylmaleimide reductase
LGAVEGHYRDFLKMQQELNWNDHIKLGDLELSSRIVMSALTRERSTLAGVPTPLVAEYYSQRASAGLIFTETTAWCQRGRTSQGAPSLYNEEQAQGWRSVTDAVHQKGGKIFVQLSHSGRATNNDMTFGLEPWAPSAVQCREKIRYLGGTTPPLSHEMTIEEIKQTQVEFEESARLAKVAGFDGIQLQGAHGYLIDQFLKSCSNNRTD